MNNKKIDRVYKTKIVLWEHREIGKDDDRGDVSPSNLLEVENGWRLREMDVKSAYLQAKGF